MHGIPQKQKKNRWLTIAIPVIVFLIGILIILIKFGASYWLNRHAPQLEQALTETTGFDTHIKGKISATLFPIPGISLANIELKNRGKLILTTEKLDTSFELLPLLDRELSINAVDIDKLHLRLVADDGGTPIVPRLQPKATTEPSSKPGFRLSPSVRFDLHDSELSVFSAKGETLHYLKGLNLTLHPVEKKNTAISDSEKELDLLVYLDFRQAKIQQLVIGQSKMSAHYQPRRVAVSVANTSVFDGAGKGRFLWTITDSIPSVSATFSLTDFDSSQSVTLFQPDPFVKGRLNLEANLSSKGSNYNELIGHVSGTAKLTGNNIDLVSTDLDELVTRIINSKTYNLTDAAAYFFIGPLAASATKSYDFANVIREMKKPGITPNSIQRMTSVWELENGIATAKDVALETTRYRLALKGRVNLIKSEFDNIQIAVIDDRGCGIVSQRLDGPIASPRIEKLNVLLTLTRPLFDVISKSAKRLSVGNCDPFYSGELLPPKIPRSSLDPARTPVEEPDN